MQMPYKAALAAIPVTGYDWTGIYFGGHIGGGWQSTAFTDPGAGQTLADCCEYTYLADGSGVAGSNSNSFLGGAQIGAYYQIGRLVVGTEFDFSKTDLNNNGSYLFPYYYPGTDSPYYNATESFGVHTDWTATATTTIGVARDRWLLYSKGGVAWAHDNYSFNLSANYDTLTPYYNVTGASSAIVTGWTAGPGYTVAPQPLTLTGATSLGNGELAIDTSGQLAGTSTLLIESAGAGSTFVTQVGIYDASGNYQVVRVDQLVSPNSPTVRVPLADGSCVAKIVVDGHSNFGGAIVLAAT